MYGFLPPNVQTLEAQVVRAYEQFRSRQSALAKNTFMTSMKDQNVVLYYKVFTTARSVVGSYAIFVMND